VNRRADKENRDMALRRLFFPAIAVLVALQGILSAQTPEPRPPIGAAPDRGWLSDFGAWSAVGIAAIVVFLLVAAYLLLRWTGRRPLPRKGPYDDVP
jgi:hypothetical protein